MLVQGEPTTGVHGDHIIYLLLQNPTWCKGLPQISGTLLHADGYKQKPLSHDRSTCSNQNFFFYGTRSNTYLALFFFFFILCLFVGIYSYIYTLNFSTENTKTNSYVLMIYTSHTNSLRIPESHHRINTPLNIEQSLVLGSIVQSMSITCAQSRVNIVGISRESSLGLCLDEWVCQAVHECDTVGWKWRNRSSRVKLEGEQRIPYSVWCGIKRERGYVWMNTSVEICNNPPGLDSRKY